MNQNQDLLLLLSNGVEEATHGSKSRARAYFKQALNISPNEETALLWLAWLSESPFEAREIINQILKINPANSQAAGYLPWVEARCKEVESMLETSATRRIWSKIDQASAQATIKTGQLNPQLTHLGEAMLRSGFLTRSQLEKVVRRQTELTEKGIRKKIGQLMIEMGFITPTQLEHALKLQKSEYNNNFLD